MKIRGISLLTATAMLFMALLPAFCAALCTFHACPEMAAPKANGDSCCARKESKKEPVSKCKVEMNKEAPPVTKAGKPTFSFTSLVLFLPLFLSAAIQDIWLPTVQDFPPPRDHSPPPEACGSLGSRAPPVDG